MNPSASATVSSLQELKSLPADLIELKGVGLGDEEVLFLARLPALRKLDLSGCDGLTDASVSLLSSLRDLRSLDLSLCNQITDRSIASLATLPRLQVLNLNWCYGITDSGLSSLSACKSIEKISLWSCEEVTDDGVEALARLPGLRELDLPEFANITDQSLRTLSVSESPIEYLRLDHLGQITDRGLLALSMLKNLREIKVHNCPRISVHAVEELRKAAPRLRIDFASPDQPVQ